MALSVGRVAVSDRLLTHILYLLTATDVENHPSESLVYMRNMAKELAMYRELMSKKKQKKKSLNGKPVKTKTKKKK